MCIKGPKRWSTFRSFDYCNQHLQIFELKSLFCGSSLTYHQDLWKVFESGNNYFVLLPTQPTQELTI
jgi:hypothetical protein